MVQALYVCTSYILAQILSAPPYLLSAAGVGYFFSGGTLLTPPIPIHNSTSQLANSYTLRSHRRRPRRYDRCLYLQNNNKYSCPPQPRNPRARVSNTMPDTRDVLSRSRLVPLDVASNTRHTAWILSRCLLPWNCQLWPHTCLHLRHVVHSVRIVLTHPFSSFCKPLSLSRLNPSITYAPLTRQPKLTIPLQ